MVMTTEVIGNRIYGRGSRKRARVSREKWQKLSDFLVLHCDQMPGYPETESPGFGTAKFTLDVQGARLEVSTQLPEGPVRPMVLLPVLQDLSSALSDLTVQSAARLNANLSCREGCGACCRQAVPITAVEARALAQLLDALPEERQTILRERFRRAAARLEESGVAQGAREMAHGKGREAAHELGLRYFELGIACPFLEEERCTIHEIRPLRCREYLVVSPAENCAHPRTAEIVGIQPPVMLSRILGRWDTNGDAQPSELILLAMLEEWAAKHPIEEDHPHRTAPELLQEFLRGFATDASAAPADPRTSHPPDLLPESSESPEKQRGA
jgi:Fe-S-cluster containining protein